MRLLLDLIALFMSLLVVPVKSHWGLDPDSISQLTTVTNWTFHSICNDFKNPTLFFDEKKLSAIINDFTTDLNMYLFGLSTRSEVRSPRLADSKLGPRINRGRMDESRLNQAVLENAKKLNCTTFEADLKHFSEVFQNMTYAISEKCYRQCEATGYSFNAAYRLQWAYEKHYYGSFFAQVREIEAEAKCTFSDTFMIETERAVDYAKVWIQTYQSKQRPCAGIGKAQNSTFD